MKRLACIIAALLLALMFALPIAAVDNLNDEPLGESIYSEEEYNSPNAYDNNEYEPTTAPTTTTQPPTTTTEEAPYLGFIDEPGPASNFFEDFAPIAAYIALGLAALALILAAFALAKTRGNNKNATGNYKKFF